jgi:hypothetical protein
MILWNAATRASVVVAVTEVAGPVIEPSTDGVDKASWIKFADFVGESKYCVIEIGLAPTFVVDDLEHANY